MSVFEKNDAPGSSAGPIFQLERALYHLAKADRHDYVAVEYADDVSITRDGQIILREQDKHSIRPAAEILSDRSRALWRTLQIWLTPGAAVDTTHCRRFLLVTNTPVTASIASMMRDLGNHTEGTTPEMVIKALRAAGSSKKSKSQIQEIIDDVLKHTDAELLELVAKIEIVEVRNEQCDQDELTNGLGLDPRLDPTTTLQALLGWLTSTVQNAWRSKKPAMVSRMACVSQRKAIEDRYARRRLLPKPAREIAVAEQDRARAMARPFVHHLGRIAAEDDDILQAIDHFIQFSIEKHRLASDGEVADSEWIDRGERLRQRWLNIIRQTKRELKDATPEEIGIRVLERSTYSHLEPLGSEPCNELYMTSGHYHRLADEDQVWWHPSYQVSNGR